MKRQILFGLFLLTVFCVSSVFAQEKSADKEKLNDKIKEIKSKLFPVVENQCELFGEKEFTGTEVSFEAVDADLQEVLMLANPFGCDFTVDEQVEKTRITAKVKNVPWNLVIQTIFESEKLGIKIELSGFRVVKSFESNSIFIRGPKTEVGDASLYTEFARLNYLLIAPPSPCFGGETNEIRNAKKFRNLLKKALSRHGAMEVDAPSNTLIITDEEERVKLITEFVKLLDESGFTLEEIVNNPNFEIK